MNSEKLNDWLQVIGIFALVASLVFVGLQIKQTQEIGQRETAGAALESSNWFRNAIIDNAAVWRSGCMGEELSAADQTKFANLYSSYIATVYWLWVSNEVGVIRFDNGSIARAAAANVHRYPGIAKMAAAKKRWSVEGADLDLIGLESLRTAIQARLAELKELEPEPLSNPDWCGSFS